MNHRGFGVLLVALASSCAAPEGTLSEETATPPDAPEPRLEVGARARSTSGDTLSVAPLAPPGPYYLAPLPDGRLVASRLDRTLELAADGRVSRELDWGGHIATDSEGSIFIAGEDQTPDGLDAFVTKLTELDSVAWTRRFAGPEQQRPREVAVDAQGNVVVMGTGIGTLALGPDGSTLWASDVTGRDFAIASDGRIVVAGGFIDELTLGTQSHYSDQPGIFIAELDAQGGVAWSRAFSGSSEVHVDRIATDVNDDLIVVGSFRGSVSLGGRALEYEGGPSAPELTGFIAKYDRDGNHVYSRRSDIANGFELISDGTGNMVLTGNQSDALALLDLRVIGADGSERWRKSAPAEIELGTGYGFDLTLGDRGQLFWSVDAYAIEYDGSVLMPYVAKLAL